MIIKDSVIKIALFLSYTFLNGSGVLAPLPQDYHYDKEKALLGKRLFYEVRLSKDNTISCASCHILEEGGDDNLRFSFGINAQEGNINAPTVLNSRYNLAQFWDGRAKDLKDQAASPIANPLEMGSSMDEVERKLQKDKAYASTFKRLYKDGLTKDNILDALAEFEKALVTPDSRFDKYLRGDKTALTAIEIAGYRLFQLNGCISCHNGINIGSNLYQKVGILKKYVGAKHNLGRHNVSKREQDKYVFKVPTLRNIALTAPYLHDGSIEGLREVVSFMMVYQLGIIPHEAEIDKIVAFLKTLTGERPAILDEE